MSNAARDGKGAMGVIQALAEGVAEGIGLERVVVALLGADRKSLQMRIALGERQWNLWGMSYGSRIGFRYAQEYPTRLRTLVLDGSWAPNLTVRSWMNGETWNYDTGKAVFSSLFGKKMAYRFQKVIDGLDERTITVEGNELTRWQILPEIFNNTASTSCAKSWPSCQP